MDASRSWLLLTAPAALAAALLLWKTIASLVRTVRESVVASLPVRAEQRVAIEHPGELALDLEVPFLTRRPTGLSFTVRREGDSMPIPLRPIIIRTESSSFSRSRLELYALTIPSAGAYSLRIDGLDPSADYSATSVVFARRYGGALVLHILALIVLGATLIGSIVFSALLLTGKIG